MTCIFRVEATFASPGKGPEDFDSSLGQVLGELDEIGIEADITASLAKRRAMFSFEATEPPVDEMIRILDDLRTALLAAQCATPGWVTEHGVTVGRVELLSRAA